MSEFRQEITERIQATRLSLALAQQDDDDYLVQIRTGELDSLERLAGEHEHDDEHEDEAAAS